MSNMMAKLRGEKASSICLIFKDGKIIDKHTGAELDNLMSLSYSQDIFGDAIINLEIAVRPEDI